MVEVEGWLARVELLVLYLTRGPKWPGQRTVPVDQGLKAGKPVEVLVRTRFAPKQRPALRGQAVGWEQEALQGPLV